MATSSTTPAAPPRIELHGRPDTWPSTYKWLEMGAERQSYATFGAIVATWTGLPFALWYAATGAVAGAISGVVGASHIGIARTLHIDEGVGVLGAIAGAFVGAAAGFWQIYHYFINQPAQLLGAILSGLLVGAITLGGMAFGEQYVASLRGYRELSRREKELLHPILLEVGKRMGLTVVPELWISDMTQPAAWAHMRSIVVTKGLIGEYDETERSPKPELRRNALAAVLAHELYHWYVGDAVGDRAVYAGCWPFVLLVDLASWLRTRAGWIGLVGWILFLPAWATIKLIVWGMAKTARGQEYSADADAARRGEDYRLGLRHALNEFSEWERPRTGWEDALTATHPAIEHRLERLETPRVAPVPDAPRVTPSVAAPVRDAPLRPPVEGLPLPVQRPRPPPLATRPKARAKSQRKAAPPEDSAATPAAAPRTRPRPKQPPRPEPPVAEPAAEAKPASGTKPPRRQPPRSGAARDKASKSEAAERWFGKKKDEKAADSKPARRPKEPPQV